MKRKSLLDRNKLLLLALLWGGATSVASADPNPALTKINPDYLVSSTEAYAWHAAKDVLGPSFAGNPSWQIFLNVIETNLEDFGAVDIQRNSWTYDRWVTSEWPDDSNWSLVSNGKPLRVAHYNPNSGSTPEEGLTAELVLFDPQNPTAEVEGKIAVVQLIPETADTPADQRLYPRPGDYMYLSNPESFPDPEFPREASLGVHLRTEMRQVRRAMDLLMEKKAAGAIWVADASYGRTAGTFTFGVPAIHQLPALYLDRVSGAQVVEDAKAARQATLRLVSKIVPTPTHQLVAYLPGKNYGTEKDEMIYLVTHTDGPSISQDNGGYGLLAVAKYFSHIPQSERPRTLMFYFDCRHYMPGAERANPTNWMSDHPEAWDKIVATMGIEHLGQMEYEEIGEDFHQTGKVEHSRLHAANNDALVAMAIKAVQDNGLRRVSVEQVDRPGIHGRVQGTWFGLGAAGRRRGLPAFATMGDMAAYWSTAAGIEAFDADHFVTQVGTMSQLVGELMIADLEKIKPIPPAPRE